MLIGRKRCLQKPSKSNRQTVDEADVGDTCVCINVYMKHKVIELRSVNQTRKLWCRTTSSRSLLPNSRSQSPLSLKYSWMRRGGSIEAAFLTKDSKLARLSNFSAHDGNGGGGTLRRLLALGFGFWVSELWVFLI